MLEIQFKNNKFSILPKRNETEIYNFGLDDKACKISRPLPGESVYGLHMMACRGACGAVYVSEKEVEAMKSLTSFPQELTQILRSSYQNFFTLSVYPSFEKVSKMVDYKITVFGKEFYMCSEHAFESTDHRVVLDLKDFSKPKLIIDGELIPTKISNEGGYYGGGMSFPIWELADGVGLVLAYTNTYMPTRFYERIPRLEKADVLEKRGAFDVIGIVKSIPEEYDEYGTYISTKISWACDNGISKTQLELLKEKYSKH